MVILGLAIAIYHRGLGFPWLALLVVAAELLIVLTRFIFSYEQAFMSDLVRFWYASLFLFASAYTLLEEGHVRVDVLYSGFREKTKGLVNAVGSVVLGISLCSVIIFYGMEGKSTIINGPLLIFETTQTGFGMYVKYWMAGFLGIFAVTMLIQFAGYFLEGVADYRGDPDKRVLDSEGALEG
jgi:TRAP-type mannitol/chloroaromatic compound transport system permease small subunit